MGIMIHSTIKNITIFSALLFYFCQEAVGQSGCNRVCVGNLQCREGSCVLTKCEDNFTCIEYCLDCYGQERCFATGTSCDFVSPLPPQSSISNDTSKIRYVFFDKINLILVYLVFFLNNVF